jgi:NADH:ubiquinone oxidoreductase subunit 5 (subunit L)/multisubunit Na+/H+ antiporter MnhA subunit
MLLLPFLFFGSLLLIIILWELVTGVTFPFVGDRYRRATDTSAYWGSLIVQAVVASFFFAALFLKALANLLHHLGN